MRPTPASSREILLLMIAASAVNFFGRTSISIAGPEIMRQYGISAVQMGTVYSAFAGAYAIAMVPMSPLSDRFGARRVLGIAGLLSALCVLATGLSGLAASAGAVVGLLLVSRFVFGVTSAPLYPACARVTAQWFQASQFGRIQGIVVGAGATGATLAPVVITAIVRRLGWPAAFYIGAAATAVVFTGWLLRVRDQAGATKARAQAPGDWQGVIRNRALLLLTLSYFAVGCVYDLFDYWSYYYFREVRHFGDSQSAVFTSAAEFTAMVMMPLGGWLSDAFASRWLPAWGRRTVPLLSLSLSAAFLLIAARASGPGVVVSLFCISFGLAAAVEGAYWATVIEIGGRNTALAYGVVNVGNNLGGFVSPLVLPAVALRFGWEAGLTLVSATALAAAASWLWVGRSPRSTPAQALPLTADTTANG